MHKQMICKELTFLVIKSEIGAFETTSVTADVSFSRRNWRTEGSCIRSWKL